MHRKIIISYIVFLLSLSILPVTASAASNLRIGAPCTANGDCRSGDCEESTLGQSYCDCDTVSALPGPLTPESEDCAIEYGKQQNEKWICADGTNASHDLDFCQSNQRGDKYPIAPTGGSTLLDNITDPEASARLLYGEIEEQLKKPQPRIKIPGLQFSEIDIQGQRGSAQSLSVPFIGEYIAAFYRYATITGAIVAVIIIIYGGLRWTISGGNAEAITGAKKKISGALIGLTLLVLTYTLLSFVNPNLVSFKNLLITYIPGKYDLDKVVYTDKTEFRGTPRPITDTIYDDLFKKFATCIPTDWRILKVIAYKESGLRAGAINKDTKYGGLFQTKPPNCRDAFLLGPKKYPEWAAQCDSVVNNVNVNTGVGAMMLDTALRKIKNSNKCNVEQIRGNIIVGGALIYLNHNSGGGALDYLLSRDGCTGGIEGIKQGIIGFWRQHKGGKWWSSEKEGRGRYAEGVAKLMQVQGVRDFYSIPTGGEILSDGSTATCPLTGKPGTDFEPSLIVPDQRLTNPEIQCGQEFEGRKVLILGDSITVGNPAGTSYADRLASNCPRMQFQKVAQAGAGTGWMYDQIKNRNLQQQGYDYLIVLGGVNNIGNVAQVQDDLNLIYNKAKQEGLKVIAITIGSWKGYATWNDQKQANTDTVNGWIRQRAGGSIDTTIDGYQILGSQGDAARLNANYDSGDHLHLNANGQAALAIQIARQAFQ